jgi:signal transduction histidine kinase
VRIARELHDVVAHHVSVMGVQAGAARVVMARDPAKATEALSSIESSSREAVVELHRLLCFLRQEGDSDELGPQPGLAQIEGLATTMSDSSLTVDVGVEGDERPLPPTVDISAYRIVQEALTNALKHSGASRADVRLRYRKNEIEVEVVDDGRGASRGAARNGGLGLIGMRERAALHGGILTAETAPEGGFAVRATLPTRDGAR